MARTTIHLMRHGEVHNPGGILYGRLPGYHLSTLGHQMAQQVADVLSASGHDITRVITSPLERARETGAPTAAAFGLTPTTDPRLIEAGNSFEGVAVNRNRWILAHPTYWSSYVNPLRPSWGEPYREIVERMRGAIVSALDLAEGHEALLLDYEMPLVRELDGKRYATSAAWPWIGNRTRGFTGPHIAFAEQITNPISVKIGPDLTPQDLVYLARTLNPTNDPGRLTFIARYGRNRIGELAPLVRASKNEGISARWMTDPMHGNTFTNHQGMKTRLLEDIVDEAVGFSQILRYEGVPVGGIHLETTPGPIQECVWQQDEQIDSGTYTPGCDPRLTTPQAQYVLERWELA